MTIELEQTRYDVRAEREIYDAPFSRLNLALGAADYTHTEFEGAETGTIFTSQGYEGRAELIQTQRGGWQGVIGTQILDRDFDAVGEEAFVPRTRVSEGGVYTVQL